MRLRSSSAAPLGAAATGFAILAFAMGVGRFAFTPLLPAMQADGLLTVEQGGTLASIHYVGYVMGAVLAGRLRMRPQALLAGAILVVGLSTAAMGLTHDFALWGAARWAAGVASAVSLVVLSVHVLPGLGAAGRSDLQGVVYAGVGVGTALVG
ncbi:MAG: YbfB/YjiJ family MFS transporter, partial [Alphaproteobacteria bacterium]